VSEITIGRVFESKHYGHVTYEGKCQSDRSPSGECHKFRTDRGKLKYITNGELRDFFDNPKGNT